MEKPGGPRGNVTDIAGYRACRGGALERLRRGDAAAAAAVEIVAAARGVPVGELLAANRGLAPVAAARQLAMYLVHTMLGRTLTEVGALFGRDRTTVAHACQLLEDRRDEGDSAADIELERLEAAISRLCSAESDARPGVRHVQG